MPVPSTSQDHHYRHAASGDVRVLAFDTASAMASMTAAARNWQADRVTGLILRPAR
jgi:hypothetical protein